MYCGCVTDETADVASACPGCETSLTTFGCASIEADVWSLPDWCVIAECVWCTADSHVVYGAGCECASTKTVLIREGTGVVVESECEGTYRNSISSPVPR